MRADKAFARQGGVRGNDSRDAGLLCNTGNVGDFSVARIDLTDLDVALACLPEEPAQTAEALQAIHGVLTLVPIGIMLILIVLTWIYPLDKEAHGKIVSELAKQASS